MYLDALEIRQLWRDKRLMNAESRLESLVVVVLENRVDARKQDENKTSIYVLT